MIDQESHIIKTSIIEIDIPKRELATEMQDKVSHVFNQTIPPILDKVLSKYNTYNEVLRIEKIELDLGKLNIQRFEEEMSDQIEKKLEEILGRIKYGNPAATKEVSWQVIKKTVNGKKKNEEGHHYKDTKTAINGTKESADTLVLFKKYISTGLWSWWTQSIEKNVKDVVDAAIQAEWPDKYLSTIKDTLSARNARLRVAERMSYKQFERFISKLYPSSANKLLALERLLVQTIIKLDHHKQSKRRHRIHVIDHMLQVFSSNHGGGHFYKNLSPTYIKALVDYISKCGIPIKDFVIQLEQGDDHETTRIFKPILVKQLKEIKSDQTITEDKERPSIGYPDKKAYVKGLSPILVESISVSDAGIVILWPYLQLLFKELELLSAEGEFNNETHQWQAVHLLLYMCMAKEQYEESELVTSKLLCGLHLDDFVPTTAYLSENEKEECDHLLQVVINNWPALKKTSIDGLRQSFLQRDAVLTSKENGWKLQLERRSYDILLDRLNWPISVIKLPWQSSIIHVVW